MYGNEQPYCCDSISVIVYVVDCRMFDSALRPQQGTPRRGCAADEDTQHVTGFRDCAREAVRFLTERARLEPDSAVVQRIRGLLDGPTDANRVQPSAAGSADKVDVPSDAGNVRRVRRTTGSAEDGKNRSVEARRCLYGRIRRRQSHRVRSRCQNVSTSAVPDRLLASSSLSGCEPTTNRVELPTAAVGGDDRQFYPLRTLQTTTASSSSTSMIADGVQLRRDVDVTAASDVAECASMLVDLAQRDSRVRNVLAELLQLMDTE